MRTKIHTQETLAKYLHEEGDCLIWTGGCSGKSRVPYIVHAGKSTPVRRLLALFARHPDAVKAAEGTGPKGFWSSTCQNPRCVNPTHAQCLTRIQHMARLTQLSNTGTAHAIKSAKIASTKRARYGKIATADIPAVLAATTTGAQEAAIRGVSQSIIWRLRTRNTARQAGHVFSGLGART